MHTHVGTRVDLTHFSSIVPHLICQGLLIVDVWILVFGVLSALKVSEGDDRDFGYPWLLICRFGVGFGAGGTSQA